MGLLVAINIWNYLVKYRYLHKGGQLHHYLWSLICMKVYGTEDFMSNLADTKRPQDAQKWTWEFLCVITNLETFVVSVLIMICFSYALDFTSNGFVYYLV